MNLQSEGALARTHGAKTEAKGGHHEPQLREKPRNGRVGRCSQLSSR